MDELDKILATFDHHAPSAGQIDRIATVRAACKECATYIYYNAPAGADRTAALRKLHECMMTANKAIVLEVTQ